MSLPPRVRGNALKETILGIPREQHCLTLAQCSENASQPAAINHRFQFPEFPFARSEKAYSESWEGGAGFHIPQGTRTGGWLSLVPSVKPRLPGWVWTWESKAAWLCDLGQVFNLSGPQVLISKQG